MLPDVVSVVGGVDDVCRGEEARVVEAREEAVDERVDALEDLQARAVEGVVVIEVCLVLQWEGLDPGGAAWWERRRQCGAWVEGSKIGGRTWAEARSVAVEKQCGVEGGNRRDLPARG